MSQKLGCASYIKGSIGKIFLPLIFILGVFVNLSFASAGVLDHGAGIKLLKSTPKFFKDDGRVQASVGTLLYTRGDSGKIFVLLGAERTGKSAGKYCELGGSMKLDNSGKAETFLQGAARKVMEESAKIYELKSNYILSNSRLYYNMTAKNREEVYIVLQAPHYASAAKLLKSAESEKEEIYKEKSKFKWVSLSDLVKCKEQVCTVKDIEDIKEPIVLRSFFYKTLQSPQMQQILKSINGDSSIIESGLGCCCE